MFILTHYNQPTRCLGRGIFNIEAKCVCGQGVKRLLEEGTARYWPRSGPAFGGKDVFILPRTTAAQAPTVHTLQGYLSHKKPRTVIGPWG